MGTGAKIFIGAFLIFGLLGPGLAFAKVKISTVATVATSGGDYSDPAAAMTDFADWCGVPSAATPCLLKIMPGVYDLGANPVVMQEYIDIEGSGENVTTILGDRGGSGGSFPGVVTGASNTEIRFLTVVNEASGGVDNAAAITYDFTAFSKALHVTAIASGGVMFNLGVYDFQGDMTNPLILTNVTAEATGGMFSAGIDIEDSFSRLRNVTARAANATESFGVFHNVDINGGGATIENALLTGTTAALKSRANGTAFIANTRLVGGVQTAVGGAVSCVGAYNGSFTALDAGCE